MENGSISPEFIDFFNNKKSIEYGKKDNIDYTSKNFIPSKGMNPLEIEEHDKDTQNLHYKIQERKDQQQKYYVIIPNQQTPISHHQQELYNQSQTSPGKNSDGSVNSIEDQSPNIIYKSKKKRAPSRNHKPVVDLGVLEKPCQIVNITLDKNRTGKIFIYDNVDPKQSVWEFFQQYDIYDPVKQQMVYAKVISMLIKRDEIPQFYLDINEDFVETPEDENLQMPINNNNRNQIKKSVSPIPQADLHQLYNPKTLFDKSPIKKSRTKDTYCSFNGYSRNAYHKSPMKKSGVQNNSTMSYCYTSNSFINKSYNSQNVTNKDAAYKWMDRNKKNLKSNLGDKDKSIDNSKGNLTTACMSKQ